MALALSAQPVWAAAEIEPNGDIASATVITSDTMYGAESLNDDRDWYTVTLAGSRQVSLAVTPTCSRTNEFKTAFFDRLGGNADGTRGPLAKSFTTPAEGGRYYIEAWFTPQDAACPYTVQVTPGDAILPTPVPPRVTVPEPNDDRSQAFGPLTGGVLYEGFGETRNDIEILYFNVAGGREVTAQYTSLGPCGFAFLQRADVSAEGDDTEYVDSNWSTVRQNERAERLFRAPVGGAPYLVTIHTGEGCRWQFMVTPADAVVAKLPDSPRTSPECRAARRQRARYARLVSQAKRSRDRARTPGARRAAGRRLAERRRLLRFADKKVRTKCKL